MNKCATNLGYKQHLKKGETPCDECKAAHAEEVRKYRKPTGGKVGRPRTVQPVPDADAVAAAKAKVQALLDAKPKPPPKPKKPRAFGTKKPTGPTPEEVAAAQARVEAMKPTEKTKALFAYRPSTRTAKPKLKISHVPRPRGPKVNFPTCGTEEGILAHNEHDAKLGDKPVFSVLECEKCREVLRNMKKPQFRRQE